MLSNSPGLRAGSFSIPFKRYRQLAELTSHLMVMRDYLRGMSVMKGLALLAVAAVIAACFFPWVRIESKDIFFGGFYSSNNNFGKPGLFHVILCSILFIFISIGRIWSIRAAFFISAINIAWALRNFVLISGCRGGECPEKQWALYTVMIASLLTTFFLLLIKPRRLQAG